MRGIRKWTGMLLAVLLGVSAPAGPGFAEPADVRVLEDGAPFLAADFENGSLGDWQLESGAPEIITEDGGKVLCCRQTGASEPLSMHYIFPDQLTGLVSVSARIKTEGGLARRDLFTLEDESGKSLAAVYLESGYIRLADTVGGYNFAIERYTAGKWDTISMVIDFGAASGNPAVWYFVNGTQIKKHIINPNEVPGTLKAKLLGLKKLTIGTPVGTGNTWLDDIRVAPCQLVDFPALALTGSTPADGAQEVAEDQIIRLNFNNPIPEEMCTAAHFRVKSVSGAVPLSQILLEDGGRTVLLEPAEELAFQTEFTVEILDLMDIHGLEQDKLTQRIGFRTQAGSLKAADYAVLRGETDISGEGLCAGMLTGRVEVRNYSPDGDAAAMLVLGLYQEKDGLSYLKDIAASGRIAVKQGEKQMLEARIAVPDDAAQSISDYHLEFHLVRDVMDLRAIGKSAYFGANGFS